MRFSRESDDTTVISEQKSDYKDLQERHTILQSKYYEMVDRCNSLQDTIKEKCRDYDYDEGENHDSNLHKNLQSQSKIPLARTLVRKYSGSAGKEQMSQQDEEKRVFLDLKFRHYQESVMTDLGSLGSYTKANRDSLAHEILVNREEYETLLKVASQNSELNSNLSKLEDQLKSASSLNMELECKVSELEEEIERLRLKHSDLVKKRESFEADQRNSLSLLDDMERQLQAAHSTNKALEQKIISLGTLKLQSKTSVEPPSQPEKELQKSSTETGLENSIKDAEAKLTKLQSKNDSLVARNKQLCDEIERICLQNLDLKRKLDAEEQKVSASNTQLEDLKV